MSTWEEMVLDRPIRVTVERLDQGFDVSVLGGDATHIGAVTLAEPDGTGNTLERPGHKDSHITRPWAQRLAETWNAPVCVRCGIHYDNATPAQLETIVAACSRLLEAVAEQGREQNGTMDLQ